MNVKSRKLKEIKLILNYINANRSVVPVSNIHVSILYVLYGMHKGYHTSIIDSTLKFDTDENDQLLSDLYIYSSRISPIIPLTELYRDLSTDSQDFFEKRYIGIINELNDEISSHESRAGGDFFTPKEISALISYYINSEGCKSLYDPFCGSAGIVHYVEAPDEDFYFEGQEISERVALIARVNVEARTGKDQGIVCTDSTLNWNHNHFDAVCSCPPFYLKLSNNPEILKQGVYSKYRVTLEEIFFHNALNYNSANIIISLETLGFSFRDGNEKFLRTELVDRNLLDTVISLPSNLLYGTSIPCLLVICKRGRKDRQPVTFIHADEYIKGKSRRRRLFDISSFLDEIKKEEPNCCVQVEIRKIRDYHYNLNPSLYQNDKYELKEGQQLRPLGSLLQLEQEGEYSVIDSNTLYVRPNDMSNSFIQVLFNANKSDRKRVGKQDKMTHLIIPETDKSYIIYYFRGGEHLFYLYDLQEKFLYANGLKVFSVDKNKVDPRYLVNLLLSNKAVINSRMSLTAFYNYSFVIDNINNQKSIVNNLLNQYQEKANKELEAEAQRLGVKQNISDLEHMLGSTQVKINNIIGRLLRITPEKDGYIDTVKQLRDNVEYMNRVIHFNNASIESESFNIKEIDFGEFLDNYLSAWVNYCGNIFKTKILNGITDKYKVYIDKAMFTVMFDSILNNAERHGFEKNYTSDNVVEIGLNLEMYKDKPYLVIRVANNGKPISDNFTIEDYITKGRFSAETGRSGLGGYHVYQVVKGHNGFLCLDSNTIWNMIVEILIPVTDVESFNLIEYEHECV